MPKGIYKRTEYHNTISRRNGFQKGLISWNKNTKGICKSNSGSFKKGNIPSLLAIKKNKARRGEKHFNWKGGPKELICIECREQFSVYFHKLQTAKTCSPECKGKYQSKIRIGKNNPNYKGGVTPENHKIRNSPKMNQWRKAIFERDDYRCMDCGQRGGSLQADHIYSFADYPRLRFILENGQTLCVLCHKAKTIFERTGRMILNSPINI